MRSLSLQEVNHYIDGKFVPSSGGKTIGVVDPSSNEKIAEVSDGTAKDVDLAVASARRAFKEDGWGESSPSFREGLLLEVARGIERHAEELATLETTNTGIPITQTKSQVMRAAENFRFFAGMTSKVPESAFPVNDEFVNYTLRKPVGVAGLITPWNTPLMLETWKMAPCLAAGNTCVLKPAEWTPLSAGRLVEIMADAGIPGGVVNMVNGFGEGAGAALVAHPGVQLISFTGETTTGKEIIRNGSSTLKRFSMELGGKNPAIVFDDADLERALDGVVFMAYSLNGERCTANSRLLVQKSVYGDFISKVADRVRAIRVGRPMESATELGPLVHAEHLKRVLGYVRLGEGEGAKKLVGGGRPRGLETGNYMEPTLFTDAKPSMRIVQEEIFGPVLAAMPFEDEKEAVRLANDVSYGLTSYIWTGDVARANRVAASVECGMTWINSHNVRDLRTPFGGTKNSGIGREGGVYSFEFYTELKTVHVAVGRHKIPKFGGGGELPATSGRVS